MLFAKLKDPRAGDRAKVRVVDVVTKALHTEASSRILTRRPFTAAVLDVFASHLTPAFIVARQPAIARQLRRRQGNAPALGIRFESATDLITVIASNVIHAPPSTAALCALLAVEPCTARDQRVDSLRVDGLLAQCLRKDMICTRCGAVRARQLRRVWCDLPKVPCACVTCALGFHSLPLRCA